MYINVSLSTRLRMPRISYQNDKRGNSYPFQQTITSCHRSVTPFFGQHFALDAQIALGARRHRCCGNGASKSTLHETHAIQRQRTTLHDIRRRRILPWRTSQESKSQSANLVIVSLFECFCHFLKIFSILVPGRPCHILVPHLSSSSFFGQLHFGNLKKNPHFLSAAWIP